MCHASHRVKYVHSTDNGEGFPKVTFQLLGIEPMEQLCFWERGLKSGTVYTVLLVCLGVNFWSFPRLSVA